MYNQQIYTMETKTYAEKFWNGMRGNSTAITGLVATKHCPIGCYDLPVFDNERLMENLNKKSLFRRIASVKPLLNACDEHIVAYDSNDIAAWVGENASMPIDNSIDDFKQLQIASHKLGVFMTLSETFVRDNSFGFEKYLVERLSKNFARAETNAFINGTGKDDNMPIGILHNEGGADVGATANTALTYEDIVALYFSIKPEYRENSVWLMNDNTAKVLRTLKNESGAYIWNGNDNTIFGKSVYISEFMPDIASGNKPIAFGDFGYFWVMPRQTIGIQPLYEKYIKYGQIGYLAYERLDGRLIRTDAVKVMVIS